MLPESQSLFAVLEPHDLEPETQSRSLETNNWEVVAKVVEETKLAIQAIGHSACAAQDPRVQEGIGISGWAPLTLTSCAPIKPSRPRTPRLSTSKCRTLTLAPRPKSAISSAPRASPHPTVSASCIVHRPYSAGQRYPSTKRDVVSSPKTTASHCLHSDDIDLCCNEFPTPPTRTSTARSSGSGAVSNASSLAKYPYQVLPLAPQRAKSTRGSRRATADLVSQLRNDPMDSLPPVERAALLALHAAKCESNGTYEQEEARCKKESCLKEWLRGKQVQDDTKRLEDSHRTLVDCELILARHKRRDEQQAALKQQQLKRLRIAEKHREEIEQDFLLNHIAAKADGGRSSESDAMTLMTRACYAGFVPGRSPKRVLASKVQQAQEPARTLLTLHDDPPKTGTMSSILRAPPADWCRRSTVCGGSGPYARMAFSSYPQRRMSWHDEASGIRSLPDAFEKELPCTTSWHDEPSGGCSELVALDQDLPCITPVT